MYFDESASPLDLHATEKRLIMQALAATNGNITAAAKKLGISRRTLHRKINQMNAGNEGGGGCPRGQAPAAGRAAVLTPAL